MKLRISSDLLHSIETTVGRNGENNFMYIILLETSRTKSWVSRIWDRHKSQLCFGKIPRYAIIDENGLHS